MVIKKLFEISDENHHCFFGYYDRPQSINDVDFIFVKSKNEFEESDVCIYNKLTKKSKSIFKTKAVSYQLGNLNNWVDDNRVIVHTNIENKIHSILYNTLTNSVENEWPIACYNVSVNKQKGLFFNIENAGNSRPAYGLGVSGNVDNCVFVKDLFNDDTIYLDLDIFKGLNLNQSEVYVEHGIFLDDETVILLARCVINSTNKKERLIQWDLVKNKAWVLNDVSKVTHFCAGHNGGLLFFGSISNLNKYSKLKKLLKKIPGISYLRGSKRIRTAILKENYWLRSSDSSNWEKVDYSDDGHPCLLGNNFIFDTYENEDNFRELYFLCSKTRKIKKLYSLPSDPLTDNTSKRCDLHPRSFSNSSFTVDTKPKEYRKIIAFDLMENNL